MPTPSLNQAFNDHYAQMVADFRWHVPADFNMGQACVGRWVLSPESAQATAVIEHGGGRYSYADLAVASNRMSVLLQSLGVVPGDRVAIVLPQRFETAVSYMACFQMGVVATPLSILFGVDALGFRLQDSGARVAIVAAEVAPALLELSCPDLKHLVVVGNFPQELKGRGSKPWCWSWGEAVLTLPTVFTPVAGDAEAAALLIYTSGTTGAPKGALIPHRALIGNLTGFMCSQNWFGFDPADGQSPSRAVFWSPADWAWTGGLMDALLPTLYFGRPIVACRERFSPGLAFEVLEAHGVSHSFLFPTALKAMMKAYPHPRRQFRFHLDALMSAGEALGATVFAYCEEELGVVVNEMFGQTEVNYVVGNCAMNGRRSVVGWGARSGSMGRGYPGHRVGVIDIEGQECGPGELGEVAVHRCDVHGVADPVFFLGYWGNPGATAAKYSTGVAGEGWCRTGDMAVVDEDGYLWYRGRSDDMFKAGGYRIGPSEIENCLLQHPAVANVAVVPKPDVERGNVVKAYIVLAPAWRQMNGEEEEALRRALQDHVRSRLAPYEYPKEIEWIDALPMTTTGKIQRRVLRLQEEERATGSW